VLRGVTPRKVGFLLVRGFQRKSMCTMCMNNLLLYVLLKNSYASIYFIGLKITSYAYNLPKKRVFIV